MSSIRITKITPSGEGLSVAGEYDADPANVVAVKIACRLSSGNQGVVAKTGRGDFDRVRITSNGHGLRHRDQIRVFGVAHTPEANGEWFVRVISEDLFDLHGSLFNQAQGVPAGKWFIDDEFDHLATLPGDPPSEVWACDVPMSRPGIYDVRAVLLLGPGLQVVHSSEHEFTLTG